MPDDIELRLGAPDVRDMAELGNPDLASRTRSLLDNEPCFPVRHRTADSAGVREAFPGPEADTDREPQRNTTDDGSDACYRTPVERILKCSRPASHVSASADRKEVLRPLPWPRAQRRPTGPQSGGRVTTTRVPPATPGTH